MKCRAGFLGVMCTFVVIQVQSLDAGPAPKTRVAGNSCRPKELTALTKSLVEASLTSFDEANGKDLGTWLPGFPELQVDQDSPVNWSKVQCSLHFMAQGLEKILTDQRNNLNPRDALLHKKLENTISVVKMLAACMKVIHREECSSEPSPPKMPKNAFDRKQWSHTLLKTAKGYLAWLELKVGIQTSKVRGEHKKRRVVVEATHQRYLEGSGYPL